MAGNDTESSDSSAKMFILYKTHDYIFEDFISILSDCFNISTAAIGSILGSLILSKQDYCEKTLKQVEKFNYLSVKKRIQQSKLSIAIITNEFMKSEKCFDLIKYLKEKNKTVIGLIVEEIECYDEMKATKLNQIDYFCEIFNDRFYKTGYDPYLWTGQYFQNLINYIETQLDEKLEMKSKVNNPFVSYTIRNENDIKIMDKIFYNLSSIIHDMKTPHFLKVLSDINVSKYDIKRTIKENREPHQLFSFVEKILKQANIENIEFYLNIIQIFVDSKTLKVFEKLKDIVSIREKCMSLREITRVLKGVKYLKKLLTKRNNDNTLDSCTDSDSEGSDSDANSIENEYMDVDSDSYYSSSEEDSSTSYKSKILRKIHHEYDKHKNEFERIGLELKAFMELIDVFNAIGVFKFRVSEMLNSKIVFFCGFKWYFDSEKFKKLFENMKKLDKNIIIIKLEEFELEIDEKDSNKLKIFDFYIHEDHDYEGYLMKKMAEHLKNTSEIKIKKFSYKLRYDLGFFCCLNGIKTDSLRILEDVFTKNNVRIGSTLRIKEDTENEDDERTDMIEKSRLVVFVLNEDYLNSSQFINELQHAQNMYKPIIFLLDELIITIAILKEKINLEQLNVIELYKNKENLLNGEIFYRFSYLVYSLLNKQNLINYENGNVCLQDKIISKSDKMPVATRMVKTHMVKFMFDFKENDHLLVFVSLRNNNICVYNRNSFVLIKHIQLNIPRFESNIFVCFNKCLDKLCVAYCNKVYFYKKNYEFQSNKQFKSTKRFELCAHAPINDNFYVYYAYENMIHVYDKTFNFIKEAALNNYLKDTELCIVRSMNILRDTLYIFADCRIFMFDLDMNLITQIQQPITKKKLHVIEETRIPNYLYLCYKGEKVSKLQEFNGNGCKFSDVVNLHQSILIMADMNKTSIINNNIIMGQLNLLIFMEINSVSSLQILSDQYYCKLVSSKPHLLVNPYKLPCGNLACLKCIYDNYNLYTNRFICYTETCKDDHFLNHQMEPSSIIKDNLVDICQVQIKYFKEMKDFSLIEVEKLESFEMLFEYIDSELEIRIESIKNTIDEQYSTLIKNLEQLKHSFLERNKNNSNEPKRKKRKMGGSNEFRNVLLNCLENYPFRSFNDIDGQKIGQTKLSHHYLYPDSDTSEAETESSSSENPLDYSSESETEDLYF